MTPSTPASAPGATGRPRTAAEAVDGQLSGNLAGGVEAMLGTLGLVPADRHDTAVAAAEQVLSRRGHDRLTVTSLRYGVLTLTGPPPAARLLTMDLDQVAAELHQAGAGVARVEVRAG